VRSEKKNGPLSKTFILTLFALKSHNPHHQHVKICLIQTPHTHFALQSIRVNATSAVAELTVL